MTAPIKLVCLYCLLILVASQCHTDAENPRAAETLTEPHGQNRLTIRTHPYAQQISISRKDSPFQTCGHGFGLQV